MIEKPIISPADAAGRIKEGDSVKNDCRIVPIDVQPKEKTR
ncbi:MAG: hypothetical protein ABSB95_12055 [Dissulfurispiraceae bacterium]